MMKALQHSQRERLAQVRIELSRAIDQIPV